MIHFNLLPEDRRAPGFPGPGFRRSLRMGGLFSFAAATWLLFLEFPRAEEALDTLQAESKRLESDARRAQGLEREIVALQGEAEARAALESGRRDLAGHLASVAQAIGLAREAAGGEVLLTRAAWASGAKGIHSPLVLEGIALSPKLSAVETVREQLLARATLGSVGPAETSWRNATGAESEGGWQWKVDVLFPGSEEAAPEKPAAKGRGARAPAKAQGKPAEVAP